MTDLKMPSPPKRHYWEIYSGASGKWMHVALMRERGLWPFKWGELITSELARWVRNPNDNARSAIDLAEKILAAGAGANKLGDLEGYRKG